ncbi:hypothetical protein LRH25_03290 [Ideonella azotifigens]|nr:hypothetical protein [Ideonella azotifigens]MCD2339359.1 hypothetical protein [Ideonella azotifigens]
MKRVHLMTLAAGALALLAACNGGSDDGTSDPQGGGSIPSSALASPEAYIDYVAKLPASETEEPVNLDAVDQPPASDTTEPVALD